MKSKTSSPPKTFPNHELADAAKTGDLAKVKKLLESGVDVNALDDRSMPWDVTPLMGAASGGHAEVVGELLKAGAKVKGKDKSVPGEGGGESVMHYAVKGGNRKVMELLMEAGAEINAVSKEPISTPIAIAAGKGDKEAVLLLLKKGADAGLSKKDGMNALIAAIDAGKVDIAELILAKAKGLDIDQPGMVGHTALMTAAMESDEAMVRLMLRAGAKVNQTDKNDVTALMWAVIGESMECTKLLVEAGADLNLQDDEKRTALYFAERDELHEIAKYLKRKGGKSGDYKG